MKGNKKSLRCRIPLLKGEEESVLLQGGGGDRRGASLMGGGKKKKKKLRPVLVTSSCSVRVRERRKTVRGPLRLACQKIDLPLLPREKRRPSNLCRKRLFEGRVLSTPQIQPHAAVRRKRRRSFGVLLSSAKKQVAWSPSEKGFSVRRRRTAV